MGRHTVSSVESTVVMENRRFTPPLLAMKFFRWVCRDEYLEEIEGDLAEIYEQKSAATPAYVLKWQFVAEVLLLLRPRLMRSFIPKYLNPFPMFKNNVTVGYRNLRRNKSYTLINLFGLSVGIASAILLFLVVDFERSFDGFHEKADRIYRIGESEAGGEIYLQTRTPLAPKLKADLPEVLAATRFISWYSPWIESSYGRVQNTMQFVDEDFADIFSFEVLEGDLKAALATKGQLVISQESAGKLFGAEPAVGKEVREIQGGKTWVIGAVLANRPENTAVQYEMLAGWSDVPEALKDPSLANWYNTFMTTYVLLENQASPDDLIEKLQLVVKENFVPEEAAASHRLHLIPITELRNMETSNTALINLLAVVAVVILSIAAVNFVNLAMAQSLARLREATVRKVIGSTRFQLVTQFLVESLMVNLGAVVLAWCMLAYAIPVLQSRFSVAFDYGSSYWAALIAATAVFSLLLGCISGAFPALFVSSVKPVEGLKGRVRHHGRHPLLRNSLLIFQFAASAFLITGTMVVWKQINYMKSRDLNFDQQQVFVVPVFEEAFTDPKKARKQLRVLAEEYASVTGIEQVAFGQNVPGRYWQNYNNFADRDQRENEFNLRQATVGSNYFRTLGVEFFDGRSFNGELASDSNAIVINKKAMQMLGWDSIEGKELLSGGDDYPFKVVGVTEDFHYQSLQNDIQPFVHFLSDEYFNYMLVRFDPSRTTDVLKKLESDWAQLNALQGFDYFFLDDEFAGLYKEQERLGLSATFFSVVAIVIASLGLFSVASFMVRSRRREISIRKVVGASIAQLSTLLSRNYLFVVTASLLLAMPPAYWIMEHFLAGFAHRIALSWAMFAVAGVSVALVAILVVALVVVRASRENPVVALRNE